MKKLNTVWASWIKVFAVAILVKFMDIGANLFALNIESLQHLVQAGVVAVIPVVINYLNPADTRYGKKEDEV
jgi:hypothetical protein